MSTRLLVEPLIRGDDIGSRERRNTVFLWAAITAVSVFVGVSHVLFNGNVALTLVLVGGIAVVIISLMRPIGSFYILLTLAMVIEQHPGESNWTFAFPYHKNLSTISPSLSGLSINPLEMHIVCIIAGVLLQFVILRQKEHQVIARSPMLLYAASLVFALLYGLSRGGNLLPALWEIRGIFYLVTLAFLVPKFVRTEQQVKTVVWIIIGTLAFRAAEVNTLYIGAGWSLGSTEGWGNHEDAGFLATMLVFFLAMALLRAYPAQRRVLLILLLPFTVAFVASGRRTVYGVVAFALVVLVLLLEKDLQRRFLKVAWKVALAFVVYLAVFWNSGSQFAGPARSLRMAFAVDDEAAGERYSSNLYRKVENYNLIKMVQKSPILGTGYGVTVDYSSMPMPLFWELGLFIPHNQLIGVAAKAGIIGFVLFWFFYLSVLAEVAKGFKDAGSPYHKAALALVITAIVNHLVYSYFDIMLTYYRTNVLLGSLLGLASVIIGWKRNANGSVSAPPPAAEEER